MLCYFYFVGDSSSSKTALNDYSVGKNTTKKHGEVEKERDGHDVTKPEPETESTSQSPASDVKGNATSDFSPSSHSDAIDIRSTNSNSHDICKSSAQNVSSSSEKQSSCPPDESENRNKLPETKLQADTNNANRFHKIQECAKEIQKKLQSLGKDALRDETIMALKNRFQSEKKTALKNCLNQHKITALENLFETELHQTKAVQSDTSSKRVICIDDVDVDDADDDKSNTASLVNKRAPDINKPTSPLQESDKRTMSPSMSPLPRSLKTESECENSDEIPDSKRKTKSSSLAEPDGPPPAKRPKLSDTSDRLVAANDTSVNVVSCANSSLKNTASAHSSVVNTRTENSSVEVRSPKSPLRNTTSDPLLTAILNDTSEPTKKVHNEVKLPHVTLKQSVDDPLPGYVKDPKAPLLGNENNPHLIAMLRDDSNGESSSNKEKHLTTTETVCKCNYHASNGSGGYYVQQKDSQMGPSLRNLQESVNQNQNTSRRIQTSKADTPHNSSTSSITYASSHSPYQSYPEANTRLTHELPRPPSPDLESISWDEIGKDWLEPCITTCTTASTHTAAETVNTRNMGRGEQLPHATQRTSYQPNIMPHDGNQNIVPSTSPYNKYGGIGTVNIGNMGGGEQFPHATHSTPYQPHIMPHDINQNIVPSTNLHS